MKKLNSIIYNKLILQAEEAKEQNLHKLSEGISNSVEESTDTDGSYNFNELENDVYQDLWRAATCIIKYHNVKSADASKIHEVLESFSSKMIEEIENSLNIDNAQIGPLEDKLPGESK